MKIRKSIESYSKKFRSLGGFQLLYFTPALILLASCSRTYEKTYEDYDLVNLKYDTEIDFTKFSTYTIADTLTIVRDTLYNGQNSYPDFNIEMDENTDGEYSKSIILSVKEHLNSLGLTELTESSNQTPELRVVITSMTLKQISRYVWYPSQFYDPWWGSGYYNNYYTYGVYSYQSSNNGSLAIDIFDLTNPQELSKDEVQLNSIWHANYEGLVGPTYDAYTQRVLDGVDEVFMYDNAFKN